MQKEHIQLVLHVDEEGVMKPEVPKWAGKYYLDVDPLVIEDLKKRGLIYRVDEVLLVADEAGEDVKIGTPFLEGTNVTGTIMEQGRSDKITVIKFKAKVRYRRKAGHRQPFTKIKID